MVVAVAALSADSAALIAIVEKRANVIKTALRNIYVNRNVIVSIKAIICHAASMVLSDYSGSGTN